MAKQMQILASGKNCLGTMSFKIQFSKMRKSEDFTTYPIDKESRIVYMQSKHRWVELNLDTKEFEVSCSRAQYADRVHFELSKIAGKNFTDKCTDEQFEMIVSTIRGTASPMAGTNGVVYCDNSLANTI